MTLNRGVLRALSVAFCVALAVVWGVAWFAPGLGLQYEDGAYLVAARALATGHGLVTANLPVPIAQTRFPPAFPALLAAWSLVSLATAWVKALPVACSAAWLWVTWRLLRTMGASGRGAALIVALTAAAPGVIANGANLFAEPLFALLVALCLMFLLDGIPLLAGICAGLATLTRLEGIPLVVACVITLTARRRLRDALLFTAPAIIVIAPWFGWALAHGARDAGSGIDTFSSSNIFTALEPGDKLIVLLHNIRLLFQRPFTALSGIDTPIAAAITAVLLAVCLIRRRHLLPDLFILLYALMLIVWTRPPERLIVPVLPLVLWMIWRVAATARRREPLAAVIVLLAILPLWQDFRRLPDTRRTGEFTLGAPPQENWSDLRRFFAAIERNTSPDAILATDLAPLFYFETGRKCIRGFEPAGFDLYYSPRTFILPPDQLSLAMMESNASYLVLTPSDVIENGAPLHTAAGALERGGVLEYVPLGNVPRAYELLRLTARPR